MPLNTDNKRQSFFQKPNFLEQMHSFSRTFWPVIVSTLTTVLLLLNSRAEVSKPDQQTNRVCPVENPLNNEKSHSTPNNTPAADLTKLDAAESYDSTPFPLHVRCDTLASTRPAESLFESRPFAETLSKIKRFEDAMKQDEPTPKSSDSLSERSPLVKVNSISTNDAAENGNYIHIEILPSVHSEENASSYPLESSRGSSISQVSAGLKDSPSAPLKVLP